MKKNVLIIIVCIIISIFSIIVYNTFYSPHPVDSWYLKSTESTNLYDAKWSDF
ncbi:MAG: hypothetical protein ACD_78C00311G0002 [uncultured bacterium (gcode 4)]|uniref:Uncharacterized protein n=1 Tax=uncultured bacterium (gcode 4) TaxID=1234023 RepID=K1XWX2_9BACT|nr:MAG: hypothetical protein ACD_78C00311G0002 [uncultured bacterium (gcode 4)]